MIERREPDDSKVNLFRSIASMLDNNKPQEVLLPRHMTVKDYQCNLFIRKKQTIFGRYISMDIGQQDSPGDFISMGWLDFSLVHARKNKLYGYARQAGNIAGLKTPINRQFVSQNGEGNGIEVNKYYRNEGVGSMLVSVARVMLHEWGARVFIFDQIFNYNDKRFYHHTLHAHLITSHEGTFGEAMAAIPTYPTLSKPYIFK